MIWWVIIGSGCIVFFSRYLFLEPKLPLKLGSRSQIFLKYSTPAVMSAIIGPILFIPDKSLDLSFSNEYLISGIITVFIAWKIKHAILVTLLGSVVFFILRYCF